MKSVFRATAILGGSSLVAIIVGLVTSKAYALLIGPSGVGMLGLLQSLAGLSGMIAGLGVGTSVVRIGANALGRKATEEVAALRRAAWIITAAAGCLSFLTLLMFRTQVSQYMLGSADQSGSVVLMGLVALFSMAAGVQTSLLNAHHRVGALAKLAIINSITAATTGVFLVWWLGERGLPWGLLIASAASVLSSSLLLRREVMWCSARATRDEVMKAAKSLIKFGLPYTASMIIGTGTQLLLPVIVLHLLGKESVGFYRAATAVSVGYIGFLLTAMGQDYYPRVSAVSHQPEALVRLVNEQFRFVMLIGVPLIMGAMAFTPILVPLIYSSRFSPSVDILEWQLAGNLLKFSSWTMSFVVLARGGSLSYFLIELVGGVTSVSATWMGVRFFGLAGLGVGFLVTYLVYYCAVRLVVKREIRFSLSRGNKFILFSSLLAAVTILALPIVGLSTIKLPVNVLITVLAVLGSSFVLWRSFYGVNAAAVVMNVKPSDEHVAH